MQGGQSEQREQAGKTAARMAVSVLEDGDDTKIDDEVTKMSIKRKENKVTKKNKVKAKKRSNKNVETLSSLMANRRSSWVKSRSHS